MPMNALFFQQNIGCFIMGNVILKSIVQLNYFQGEHIFELVNLKGLHLVTLFLRLNANLQKTEHS